MDVIFHRTGERCYAVSVRRPGEPASTPAAAPGFDPHAPHDLLHLLVEIELGLEAGVFGQMAAGGNLTARHPAVDAPTDRRVAARQRRKRTRRRERLKKSGREETAISERATWICLHTWLSRSARPARGPSAPELAASARRALEGLRPDERARLTDAVIDRVCDRLDELSPIWTTLEVGESMTVRWETTARRR